TAPSTSSCNSPMRTALGVTAAALLLTASACNCGGGGNNDAGAGGGGTAGGGSGTGGGTAGGSGGGSGGGAGGGGGGPSLSKSQYCPALAGALCGRESKCGFLDPGQNQRCLTGVQARCEEDLKKDTAGTLLYQPPAGGLCVAT